MIGNHSHTSVNINRMNENILLRIEIPNLNQTNNNPYYLILIILLVIVYIYRRHRLAKWSFYNKFYYIDNAFK